MERKCFAPLVQSLARPIIIGIILYCSFIHFITHPLIHSITILSIYSFIPSNVYLFTCSFFPLFNHSLIYSFIDSFIHIHSLQEEKSRTLMVRQCRVLTEAAIVRVIVKCTVVLFLFLFSPLFLFFSFRFSFLSFAVF